MKENNNVETILVKLNLSKKEKKEVMAFKQGQNVFVACRLSMFRIFHVGMIENIHSMSNDGYISISMKKHFAKYFKDNIDYLDFKREYLKQKDQIVFEIKLKNSFNVEETKKLISYFE